jgi:hypothetical protein
MDCYDQLIRISWSFFFNEFLQISMNQLMVLLSAVLA